MSLQTSLHLENFVRIGTVDEWACSSSSAATTPLASSRRLPLLDLRSQQDYEERHIHGSVHIPLVNVKQRSYELPPRQNPFVVLIPDAKEKHDADDATDEATALLIHDFFLQRDSNQKKRAQRPWNIPMVLLANDPRNWEQAQALGLLVAPQQKNNKDTTITVSVKGTKPMPRLWQPDRMVQDLLLPLLLEHFSNVQDFKVCHEIWDLGAGSGRDVCFLAEELQQQQQQQISANGSTHFCVVGMDQRYRHSHETEQQQQEEECLQFWRRRNVASVTRCVSVQWGNHSDSTQHKAWFQQELNKNGKTNNYHPFRRVMCLYAVRFWNQSLLEFLAKDSGDILESGTLVAVSQFAKPFPGAPWDFDHPKEKNVLERDQLRSLFSVGWKILHDNIVPDSDHGRTLLQFVAQKL